jgi:hypothetical protein
MAIDDALTRSKSVASGTPIDTWLCQAAASSFEIIIESLDPSSSAVEIRAVFDLPPGPDILLATLRSTDRFPSGPHLLEARDKTQIQLNALPADAGQTSCAVSYTFKWLK